MNKECYEIKCTCGKNNIFTLTDQEFDFISISVLPYFHCFSCRCSLSGCCLIIIDYKKFKESLPRSFWSKIWKSERGKFKKKPEWSRWDGKKRSPFNVGIRVKVRYRGYPDRMDDVLDGGIYPFSGWLHSESFPHRDIVSYKIEASNSAGGTQ